MNLASFMIYVLAIFAIAPMFTYVIYNKLGLGLNIFGIFGKCNGNCICDLEEKTNPFCGDCIYDFSNPETCKNIKAILWAKKNLCYHVQCYDICEDSYNRIIIYYGENDVEEKKAIQEFNESHCCLLLGRYPRVLQEEYYCDKNGYLRKG